MRVVLHIGKLVLRDLEVGDAKAVATGLKSELSRLIAEPGVAAQLAGGGNQARIAGGQMTLRQAENKAASAETGRSLGRAVGASILGGKQT